MNRLLLTLALLLLALPANAMPMDDMDDEDMRTSCGFCAGLALLIPLVFLITSVVIAVWVYRDAEDRGDRNAALWAIIGFLFNFIGLLIYLLVRKQATPPPPAPPAA